MLAGGGAAVPPRAGDGGGLLPERTRRPRRPDAGPAAGHGADGAGGFLPGLRVQRHGLQARPGGGRLHGRTDRGRPRGDSRYHAIRLLRSFSPRRVAARRPHLAGGNDYVKLLRNAADHAQERPESRSNTPSSRASACSWVSTHCCRVRPSICMIIRSRTNSTSCWKGAGVSPSARRSRSVAPGALILAPAGVPHGVTALGDERLSFITVIVPFGASPLARSLDQRCDFLNDLERDHCQWQHRGDSYSVLSRKPGNRHT